MSLSQTATEILPFAALTGVAASLLSIAYVSWSSYQRGIAQRSANAAVSLILTTQKGADSVIHALDEAESDLRNMIARETRPEEKAQILTLLKRLEALDQDRKKFKDEIGKMLDDKDLLPITNMQQEVRSQLERSDSRMATFLDQIDRLRREMVQGLPVSNNVDGRE